jgi:5-methylcytosine-specific restriction endonuclease McrBC regulatory subunit McrC
MRLQTHLGGKAFCDLACQIDAISILGACVELLPEVAERNLHSSHFRHEAADTTQNLLWSYLVVVVQRHASL